MLLNKFKTPSERAIQIAEKEKTKRKSKKITQKELSNRTGISLASIKRFEQTGEISFVSLLKIADVLNETDAFDELFSTRNYHSIQEIIDENR